MLLWRWFRQDPPKARRLGSRIFEGLREVGVLLIAFAPLEAGLSEKDVLDQARFLVGFLGGGFLVFGLTLVLEWRFLDVD